MTLRVKVDGSFVETGGAGGAEADEFGWVRPADWLALPAVGESEQKFVGLYAVTDDDSNFLSLLARGAYTVDWGDGTVEDVADNVQANHLYDYSTIGAETLSSRGYKQVIVTVTPQSGSNLTTVNLNQRHPTMTRAYNVPWLDITVGSPNLTTLQLYTTLVNLYSVEQVTIKSHAMTSMASMFRELRGLQSVPLFDTAIVTTMRDMFNGCSSLQTVPLFNTVGVTDMRSAFQNCTSLQSVPLFNTTSCTVFTWTFRLCTSLSSVSAINMAGLAATNQQMFIDCPSLASISATGIKVTFSVVNCKLSRTALVEVFTNLADLTGLTAQTITITGNWGIADLTANDRLIATNKNWTLVE